VTATFNDLWAERSAWRGEFSFLLRLFSQWLKENGLLDSTVAARIAQLEQQVRFEKLTIAFVAEYSRGKSELINALFFADYGRRILPARAGRTTMCPTEIGYEPGTATCLRLLPIQTRLQPQSLLDWRAVPEAWVCTELDETDANHLAGALERVTETLQISTDEAHALGFFQRGNPAPGAQEEPHGLVTVPKWRHAILNIPHPLLGRGLVVLDTPGLNAIGAEPELTLELIAQTQAVVFVLGADTAVTQSDLAIWQNHFANGAHGVPRPLVVLNKLDTLWDTLSSPEQVKDQIAYQKAHAAQKLKLEGRQVLAVSAKSALIAKVSNNVELLAKSCIASVETALVHGMLEQGNQLLSTAVNRALTQLQLDIGGLIHVRKCDVAEKLANLLSMQGSSKAVLTQMRREVAVEQQQFELGQTKFAALIAVQGRLFRELFLVLDEQALRQEVQALTEVLARPGLKLSAKNAFDETFDRLHGRMHAVQALIGEIVAMHAATFEELNTQLKFSLGPVTPPSMEPHRSELKLAQLHHAKHFAWHNVLGLQKPEFVRRLAEELHVRSHRLRDGVFADLVVWRNSLTGEVNAQLGLRRASLEHRREAIEKIEQVGTGMAQRAQELSLHLHDLEKLAQKLEEQAACLIGTSDDKQALDVSLIA
jgi:hypothetical protein